MNQLYLKRIALKEFRSFASLDIELPAEPSVLIVHGSNGLGKSSLFDSLEWTLSDSIDHFKDVNGVKKTGAYLCRWRDGGSGATSAALQFSDGSIIERSLASPKAVSSQLSGNVPDIIQFLRSPNWKQPISELQRYLLLTHFLGQSTFSRLTYRDSSERFDILKEAARSTDIDTISNALHGQGNTTVARAYSKKIEELEREVQGLSELLEQEATLFAEARISGAVDDRSAAVDANRIIEQLSAAYLSQPPVLSNSITDVELLIEEVIKSLDNIEQQCLSAEKLIGEARQLSDDFAKTRIDIADIVASDRMYREHAEDIRRTQENAKLLNEQHAAEVLKYQRSVAEKTSFVSSLRALSDIRSLAIKLEAELREKTTSLESISKLKSQNEREVTLAERRQQIRSRITTEISNYEKEIVRLGDKKISINKILRVQAEIAQQSANLSELQSKFPDLAISLKQSEQDAATAEKDVESQQLLVNELRVTVDEMSSAISKLATSLPKGTCECPLCDSHFDNSTILNERVSTAAQRLAPTLTTQENLLRDKLAIRERRLADFKKIQDAASTLKNASSQLELQREFLTTLVDKLEEPSVENSSLMQRVIRIDDEVKRLGAKTRRKLRWISHSMLDPHVWASEHSRALRARDAAQRSYDEALRACEDINNALKRAHLDEDRTLTLLGPDHLAFTQNLAPKLQEEESILRALTEEISRFTRMENDSASSIAVLNAETKGIQARLAEMAERKDTLEEKLRNILANWRALQQFGTSPQTAPVDEFALRVFASRHILQEARPQFARLREGRFAWARQRSHATVLDQIRGNVKATSSDDRDELIRLSKSKLSQKQEELAEVTQVKAIARDVSASINTELAEFNSEYIKPLGNLMSQLNQAILCDPRVGIDLHVKHKKIEQIAVKGNEVPKSGKIDPLLVHSEGQMAALAVSMLCAASLTFPWSRWKALILDDPLQHNDSIHVAAL